MAVNLGQDARIARMKNLTGSATGFAQEVIDFCEAIGHSSTTPFGAAALSDILPSAIPAGTLLDYGGASAPTGYLLCDGASVLRATYPDLFAAIGTRFGSASGTHFNLPDCRRRITLGAGGTVPGGTNGPAATVGATGGNEEIILSEAQLPAHTHDEGTLANAAAGAHSHTLQGNTQWSGSPGQGTQRSGLASFSSDDAQSGNSGTTSSAAAHTHAISGDTGSTGTGADVGIMPPVIVVTKIIKT